MLLPYFKHWFPLWCNMSSGLILMGKWRGEQTTFFWSMPKCLQCFPWISAQRVLYALKPKWNWHNSIRQVLSVCLQCSTLFLYYTLKNWMSCVVQWFVHEVHRWRLIKAWFYRKLGFIPSPPQKRCVLLAVSLMNSLELLMECKYVRC